MTEEFRRHARQWRRTIGVPDEALVEMIRQDGVDILVDLTLHAARNRLPIFARQPAPVQVSFAGYPEGTGLETIGYRISDRYLESEIEVRRSEFGVDLPSPNSDLRPAKQVCLIESFWCYDPCGVEVQVNGLPAQENGYVTFGSLNDFAKLNEPVLKLWARVLCAVRDSRLVLLAPPGSHRQRTVDFLRQWGVDVGRVEFVERRPHAEYLALYHRLDFALDPFPYGGHTTSLDALWMGVPVVSLVGPRRISRAGWSHLSRLSLEDLTAFSEDDYVNVAARLALDVPRLAALRAGLRARMQSSVLMDAPRFTRNIEVAYRTMWQQWCAQEQP